MPYKVMIVDDEHVIRDGLMSYHWEQLGFTAAGCASDGIEALELLENNHIDVAITDIRMPKLDGLELSKIIKEKFSHCKTVILTGYKDFEYAKSAISYGVSDYLMKPVSLKLIDKLMEKIRSELDTVKAEQDRLAQYEKLVEETVPAAVCEFVNGIIEGRIADKLEIDERMDLLEIQMNNPCYLVMVCRTVDTGTSKFQNIMGIIKDHLETANLPSYGCQRGSEQVFILNFDREGSLPLIRNYIRNTIDGLKDAAADISNVGVGKIYNNILFMPLSYRQANKAMEESFFREDVTVFYAWEEHWLTENGVFEYPCERENDFIDLLLEGNCSEVEAGTESFLNELATINGKMTPKTIQDRFLQFLTSLENKIKRHGTTLKDISGIDIPFIELIESRKNLHDLKQLIQEIVLKTCSTIKRMNNDAATTSYKAIQRAIQFIKANYNKKITLDMVAEQVYMNSSYLSVQFKRETGKNFVEYIRNERIERAKELLCNYNLKVYEIGESVGFQNPKYFTDVFKEHTGISPNKYRQKHNAF